MDDSCRVVSVFAKWEAALFHAYVQVSYYQKILVSPRT